MIISQRIQFLLFFVVVAIVYAIAHQDVMVFYRYDPMYTLSRGYDYPLPRMSAPVPYRLIDNFYGPVYNGFNFKYIYGLFYEPFFGKLHFVDVIAFGYNFFWAVILSGFTLISICYARLFTKINIWQMGVYALLFYLFFAQYDYDYFSFNLFLAYDSVILAGLCFIYPLAHYVLAKKDVFSNWNETYAISLMVVLCYFAYFTILFVITFVSIALLCLLAIHLSDSYQRSDFQSIPALWQKVKTEPKWVLVSAALSPILALTSILIGLIGGHRLKQLLTRTEEHKTSFTASFDRVIANFSSRWEESFGYDDKQIAFLIIILVFAVGVALYPKWKSKNWEPLKPAIQRLAFFSAGIILLTIFIFAISVVGNKSVYLNFGVVITRFVLITFILGLGFKLLQHKIVAPMVFLLFFIFSFGSIKAMTSMEVKKSNPYHMHSVIKSAANLAYTFNCYGEEKIPFYDSLYLNPQYFKWRWEKMFRVYMKTDRNVKIWGTKRKVPHPKFIFYYEPSIAKINAKLAELQKTKLWQCARVKNDIYRVEKIDY